jgi:hypothetical protein
MQGPEDLALTSSRRSKNVTDAFTSWRIVGNLIKGASISQSAAVKMMAALLSKLPRI